MRQQARALHAGGRLIDAINLQLNIVNLAVKSGDLRAEDYHRLGVMFFAAQDFPNAAAAFEMVYKQAPDFQAVSLNLGLALIRLNRFQEAIDHLKIAETKTPADLNLLDGLAEASWKAGDREMSCFYGEKSLLLKDRIACGISAAVMDGGSAEREAVSEGSLIHRTNAGAVAPKKAVLPGQAPSPFCPGSPEENVISFSLFGNRERYLLGAVKNVTAASEYYPGWRCRFYCDDQVPKETLAAITRAGGDIRMMPRPPRFADGLFWRFLVADDPSVVRFLIRDCDSVITSREKYAVYEWLASDRYFHIMRDNCSHTDLMLAGMWGGVAGILPPLATLLKDYAYNPVTESRTADQLFLGRVVWPMVKESCLIHDRIYRVFNSRDFPPGSELPAGRHVGDNDSVSGAIV